MKSKVNILALIAMVLAFCLSSCNNGATDTNSNNQETTTTVLVYVVGSDLETKDSAATKNIKQMMAVGSTNNMNVIMQTGGSLKTNGDYNINWQHVQRYQVNNGSLALIQDLGADSSINMGSESALADFIQWGVSTYKADKYILVLWNHGGGPNGGFGSDEISSTIISMPSVIKAVSQANTKFEIIGFDACLMGSAEIAAGLAPYANYLIASEDIEPGNGWDYTPFLDAVTTSPEANGAEIGKVIADGYLANNSDDIITLSVIDLSQAANLVAATNHFMQLVKSYIVSPTDWLLIADARVRSLDFATSSFFRTFSSDLVDLQQLAGNITNHINKAHPGDINLNKAMDSLVAVIQRSVVYKVSTLSDDGATGLTIYFPSILASYPSKDYPTNTTFAGNNYFAVNYVNEFLPSYYNLYMTEKAKLIAEPTVDPVSDGGVYNIQISNSYNTALAANGKNNCTIYNPNNEAVTVAYCYTTMMPLSSAESDAGIWKISYNKSQQWPTLEGKTISLIPDLAISKQSAYNSYLIPVFDLLPNQSYALGYLRVEEINGEYSIKGIQYAAEQPGKTFPLKAGHHYSLASYIYLNTGDWAFYRNDQVITLTSSSPKLGFGSADGNIFTAIVDDLTGAVHVANSQAY